MTHVDPAWLAGQQRRWMRPNAHLYVRPDAYRFMPPDAPRRYGKDAVRCFWPQPADAEPHAARAAASIVSAASQFAVERAGEERARKLQLLADRQELLRLKRDLLLLRLELKFRQLLRHLLRDHKAGFRPDQPRWPAGSGRIGGQWSGGAGTGGPLVDPNSEGASGTTETSPAASSDSGGIEGNVILAASRGGGIPRALWNLTVRQFVSRYCRGSINRELPSQFDDVTLADLIEIAKGGNEAAKKCYKLLNQPRFRKMGK